MQYITRKIESSILHAVKTFPGIVITGPRQSGKTTLLKHLLPDYRYITFDDPLSRERARSDPNFFLNSLGEKAIIDEIQHVPEILSYIKIKIDEKREVKGRFVFTGSQQFHLMKNIGDTLAGRIAVFDLLPFSVTELESSIQAVNAKTNFLSALKRGSYPELVLDMHIDAGTWFRSYFQTYLERDIRGLYNIGSLRDFQQFVRLLAARCSEVLNLSSYSRDLGISIPTIKTWLSILEASRIIFLLPPWYNNQGKRITKSPKLYFLDTGFAAYLSGVAADDSFLDRPLAGNLFENYIIQETVKSFLHQGKQPPIYFFRTNNQLEIDIIIEKSAEYIIPVEIKLTQTPRLRDGAYLERFRQLFTDSGIQSGLVVSLSEQSLPLSQTMKSVTLSEYLNTIS